MSPLSNVIKSRSPLCCVAFDRIVITGMLPEIGHAEAMARYLSVREIHLFDYPAGRSHCKHLIQEEDSCPQDTLVPRMRA